jgi:hypothetical protein
MTEQQITTLANRYLSQVSEAFKAELQAGRVGNETSAIHCISWAEKHIQQIAQNNTENLEQKKRLWYIRDSMDWLIILCQQQDEILSRSGLPVPSEQDARQIRFATMICRI